MSPVLAQPARSDRSFERLYRRHAADVYRYAYAVLQNRADAEDVTQTTFMNAYRALQRGERPQRPHNWLIAIAHNVCRQRFRRSQRRPSEVEWQEDIAGRAVADDELPTADDIRRALLHLPFNQRAALVMRELEGRSYAEIGELLELSTAAVETLIFRARRALREQLEGTLTCGEAELAISKQLDGRLSRAEQGQLRAHLRECAECASFARRQRAQRTALRSLGSIPLPASLASLFGGGGTPAAVVAAKAVAVAAAAAVAGGASYEAVRTAERPHPHPRAAVPATVERAALPPAATAQLAAPVDVPRPVARPRGEHAATKHTRAHARGRTAHAHTGKGAAAHTFPPAHASSAAAAHGQGAARSAAVTVTSQGHGRGSAQASPHAASAHASHSHTPSHGAGKSPRASPSASHGSHGSSSHAQPGPPAPPPVAAPAQAPGPPQTPPGRSGQGPPGKHGASFSP